MKGSFVCVWNCLIFFVGEYSSVWTEICRVLSQIQWRFLRGISGKKYFGQFFRNFVQTKVILYRNLWNFTLVSEILFWDRIALKKFTQVLSYVLCTLVRTHVNKISQKEYTGEKTQDILFSENQFCSPSIWDLLRLTLWVFLSWATHTFDLKFVAFFFKFSGDSYMEFQEKNYCGRIFQKFCANQGYPLPKLVKFRPTFWNFILGSYCAEKIHTSTFICCLHPGKEARP